MALQGIHHITAITGDARANVDFYARVMGLRMVKKTVNFDVPDIYHLYFGDESGTPGSILTFFEYPGAPRGHHGAGMIHTIQWGVADEEALDFWHARLSKESVPSSRSPGRLRLQDPEGLGIELVVDGPEEGPLSAAWPEIPPPAALRGFAGVRVFAHIPAASKGMLRDALGFEETAPATHRLTGGRRRATYAYERPPHNHKGHQGAGTVHHIAWAAPGEEHEAWLERVLEFGLYPTPIIDRQYFRSIYFREPSGVLFEIATIGPGFGIDEPLDHLGESLKLPPQYEARRGELERALTALSNPRSQIPREGTRQDAPLPA